MNKGQIWGVLECCLLISDGVTFNQLVQDYGFNQKIAEAGYRLFSYLKSIEIKEEVIENV
jgi:hypothetical protein